MGVMHKALRARILAAIAATALMAATPLTASAQGLIRDAEIEKILRDYSNVALYDAPITNSACFACCSACNFCPFSSTAPVATCTQP